MHNNVKGGNLTMIWRFTFLYTVTILCNLLHVVNIIAFSVCILMHLSLIMPSLFYVKQQFHLNLNHIELFTMTLLETSHTDTKFSCSKWGVCSIYNLISCCFIFILKCSNETEMGVYVIRLLTDRTDASNQKCRCFLVILSESNLWALDWTVNISLCFSSLDALWHLVFNNSLAILYILHQTFNIYLV